MKLNFNPKINLRNFFFITIFSTILFSCSGGGGGGVTTDTSGTCKDGNSSSFCTTEFHANYGLKNIKAYEAYDDGYSGSGVDVSVMDGGFDLNHSDVNFQSFSYDAVNDDNDANSESPNSAIGGHGTHVAGIISAKRGSTGMHGVAYASNVVAVRMLTDSNSGISDMTAAIDYASSKSSIVNNSWGTAGYTSNATCTINGVSYTCRGVIPGTSSSGFDSTNERNKWNDFDDDDAVAVFAAGNDGVNSETGQIAFYTLGGSFLAYYDVSTVLNAGLISQTNRSSPESRYPMIYGVMSENWMNVVSVNSNNTISSFSNGCGDTKDYCIAAPGEDIYSTVPTSVDSSGYDTLSGTSMAAPHVSGALALMKQKWPNLTAQQLVDLILNNATDLGASGTDQVYGRGLLNLKESMAASGALEITYAKDDGTLKKYLVSDTQISTNKLMKNLNTDLNLGVVDSYERVYSIKLNDIYVNHKIDENLYIYERNYTHDNRLLSVNNGLFYIDNVNNFSNDYFNAEDRIYNYDNLGYEKYVFANQQNFHIPFGESLYLITDTEEFDNYILKSDYQFTAGKFSFNIENGLISENKTVLGNNFSGAFEIKDSQTYFSNIKNSLKINNNNFKLNILYGITSTNFEDSDLINMSDIHTLSSTLAYEKTFKKSKFSSSLELPMHIVEGSTKFINVSGYDEYGNYKNTTQTINLRQKNIDGSINFYYDTNINEYSNFGLHYSLSTSNNSDAQIVYYKKF